MAELSHQNVNAEIASQIYRMRTEAGLSQRELAKLIGTHASAICRLENPNYGGHTTAMLNRIASVLKKKVQVRFVTEGADDNHEESLE